MIASRLDHTEGGVHRLHCWVRLESYLKNMGMAGLASALAMVRRRPKEYRRKVDAVTRCYGVCPHILSGVRLVEVLLYQAGSPFSCRFEPVVESHFF